jgi:hypothetical protein
MATISPPALGKSPLPFRLLEWDIIGWVIAALLGAWGAMLGIGQFALSLWMLRVSGLLMLVPVGVCAHRGKGKLRWCLSSLVFLGICGAEVRATFWIRDLAKESQDSKAKLDRIPAMQAIVNNIDTSVTALRDLLKTKPESSPDAVLSAAADKLKELDAKVTSLEKTTTSLSSRRQLSVGQQKILYNALLGASCQSQPIPIALVWEPYDEAADYAAYFIKTTDDAKCLGYRAALQPKGLTIRGVELAASDWDHPSRIAETVRTAFNKANIQYTLRRESIMRSPVAIVIGAKP